MQRHHTVQNKYLAQWKNKINNQLNIYLISKNEYIERGPNWKGFWKKDYNIYDEDKNHFYLPEEVTNKIDTTGIEAIKKLERDAQKQLDGFNRSALAFYVALQYVRTPRFREETDKFMEENIKFFMRKDISSPDKFKLSKEELLKQKPKNQKEKEALEKISTMTEEEINQQSYEFLHSDDFKIKLTNTGHSKQILKIDRLAINIFELKWLFLITPKETSFITSDNPCFTIASSKIRQGLLSPNALIIFPLRPDVCIIIKPSIKSKTENYLKIDRKKVRDINKLILENSYQSAIAKDKTHLENLTKNYDYKNHRKSRNVAIYKKGNYVMFNLE